MPNRVCVIDLPGMSRELLEFVPRESRLGKWLADRPVAGLTPSWPAVTCSVQATLTTGVGPEKHGIIANGLPTFRFPADQALVDASSFADYRRTIGFWEQSNQFLESRRFWQNAGGKSRYKTALLFFQNSMPGFSGPPRTAADIVLTPKPEHGADGKIVSLCWSEPRELVGKLFAKLGPFPLMNYWGPMAGIAASQWIGTAAAVVWRELEPALQWVYVPHLDYDLQRFGPDSPQAAAAVRDVAAALEEPLEAIAASGGKIVLLSEYSMRRVSSSIAPNRILAEAGLLLTRDSPDGKIVDFEKSEALAMVDHQIAHVYARDATCKSRARDVLAKNPGIRFRDTGAARHRRSGDLLLEAEAAAWFDYRWWSSPADAPAFAGMVDIHRKPGYDPLELFFDPRTHAVTQDAGLIRGSHGLVERGEAIFVAEGAGRGGEDQLEAAKVGSIIDRMVCG